MAKISLLPRAEPLRGDETLPIVQDNGTRRTTMAALIAGMVPFLQSWYKGDRGDPGGNVMATGPFESLAGQTIPEGATVLRTAGETGGIVNENPALSDAEIAAHPLVRTKDRAGRRFERNKFALTARQFGAGGLGQDVTSAIQSYQSYVQTQEHDVAGRTDPLGLIGINLEPGSYLINSSGAFLDETFTSKRGGWGITGEGPGTTQVVFAPTDAKKAMIHNVAYLGVQLNNFTTVCDDVEATFLRSEARNFTGLNPQAYRIDLLGFSGAWDTIFDVLGDGNNSEWAIDGCAAGGPGRTVEGSSGTFLRLRDFANGSEQQLNYWVTRTKPWFDDPDRFSCFIDAEAGSHIHVDMCDMSGWKRGTHFILRKSGFGAFSVSRTRAEMKTENVKSIECTWAGGYVSYDRFDSGPIAPYNVNRATITHDYLCNPGPDISYKLSKILGTMIFRQNPDPSYGGAGAYNQGYRQRQTIIIEHCQFPQFEDVFDAIKFSSGNGDGSAQPKGGLPVVRLVGCRGRDDVISSPFWAANRAYSVGAMVQNGPCEFVCTQGGTSASFGRGPLTKGTAAVPVVDGTCRWAWVRNDPRSYMTDAVINAHTVPNAEGVTEHFVYFGNYDGATPNSGDPPLQVIIPPHAIITRAWLSAPANAVVDQSGNPAGVPPRLQIRTDNGALLMIDNVGSSTPASEGVNLAWAGRFDVGTNIGNRAVWGDAPSGLSQNLYGVDWGFAYIA